MNRVSTTLLALALTTGTSAGAATAASPAAAAPRAAVAAAADDVQGGIMIRDSLVLYASDTEADPLVVPFRVSLQHSQGIAAAHVAVDRPDGEAYFGHDLTRISGTPTASVWGAEVRFTKYAQTGLYTMRIQVRNDRGELLDGPTQKISVRRNTSMPSFNASPEPVRPGGTTTVAGRLTRLNPSVGYVGYGGKTVGLYFKPVGGQWVLKGTTTTDSSGHFRRAFSARVSGTREARFAGTVNYDGQISHRDRVDVS